MKRGLRESLQWRLILGSAVGVVLAVLLAGLFIANLYRVHTTDRFQTELDHHLSEVVTLITMGADGRPAVVQPLSDPQFQVAWSGLYWQVDGEARVRSPSLAHALTLVPAATDSWTAGRVGSEPVLQRTVRVRVAGHPLTVTMASAQQLLDQQIGRFALDLGMSMIVVAALLLGGAAVLVRFGLTPVRRLGEEVEQLRHGRIDRLDPHVPTEFEPVVGRFNALIEAQSQLIARARTEAGNLAHNLRTPLALITDEAEQLRLSGQQGSADFLLDRCAQMQRQIDYHLARAAAAGTRGGGTLTAVAPLLEQIIGAMRRLHAERTITVTLDLATDLHLPCDRGDLAEILSNLIDNAYKWTRQEIVIAGQTDFVTVCDDGVGVPAADRARILDIGTRLDPAAPGSGLGLAATVDLLSMYGAELVLDDAMQGGLSATIVFNR
jgi:signal transduction histidine kinase